MSLTHQETATLIEQFQLKPGDSGSVEAQVALLTRQIAQLTEHFKVHQHDFHSRRGLMRKVSLRKKLLNYLKRINSDRFMRLVNRLNLRYR